MANAKNSRGGPCVRPNEGTGHPQGAPLQIFFRDIKFEHSIFALPFAYLGLFLAEGGRLRFRIFFCVSVAMVSFRTFAMAMNRLLDREIDAKNPRTQGRALPQNRLTLSFVWRAALLSLFIFLASTWFLRPLCFFLSPIPIFLASLYPSLKRFTWFSHIVLGIILGISPYGAWLARGAGFSWIPGLLLVGVASWVAGFDILYSLQDFEFDRGAGLQSLPVSLGKARALGIARGLDLVALLAWAGAGVLAGLGWIYGGGLVLVSFFLIRKHGLVERFGLAKIDQAFFTMNAGVSIVIFLAALLDLHLR